MCLGFHVAILARLGVMCDGGLDGGKDLGRHFEENGGERARGGMWFKKRIWKSLGRGEDSKEERGIFIPTRRYQ